MFPPAERGTQQVRSLHWTCHPEPDEAEETEDEFGNRLLLLHHRCIPHAFHFSMQLETERNSSDASQSTNFPATGIGAYLLPSALCDRSPIVLECVRPLQESSDFNRTIAPEKAARLNALAHKSLTYEAGATGPQTTASMVLEKGIGVCQDYTHLLIALCRCLCFPARYISGYNPAEGVMHAWAEIFYEGEWHAWDPTHNRPTRDNCVFVACGRDYRDVLPVSGTYRGKARAELSMICRTTVVTTPR